MWFVGAPKMSTNTLGQLLGSQQQVRLHNNLPGVDPPGLDRVEPGTFGRQKKRQNAHSFVLLLDLLVVLSDPGPNHLAVMPGGIIPDQQPGRLARCLQPGADPLQELGGDGADRTAIDKAQRYLTAE